MAQREGRGPFRPGPGGRPPYLAGREAQQRLFRELLSELASASAPETQVVVCGPRGNGKTALLAWLETEASAGSAVEALQITPSEIPTCARFAEALLPESWWKRYSPTETEVAGIHTGDPGPSGRPQPGPLSKRGRGGNR